MKIILELIELMKGKTMDRPQDLQGMARLGYIGNIELYVNTDDPGKIPHFHFRDKDNWHKFHGCIRIDKAEYFHHGNKKSILNSKQKKELVQFLREKPKHSGFYGTNWQLLLDLWNMNNSDFELSSKFQMPNYLELR